MKRALVLGLAAVVLVGAAGCEKKKFTMQRFDTMVHKGQSKMEVEKILGAPDARWDEVWKWVDWDEGYSGKVVFNESGTVIGKSFSSATRSDPDAEAKMLDKDWPEGDAGSSAPPSSGGTTVTQEEVVVP
jgi:hypothetical protein